MPSALARLLRSLLCRATRTPGGQLAKAATKPVKYVDGTKTAFELASTARKGGDGAVRLGTWERQHLISVALCDRLETVVRSFRRRVDEDPVEGPGLATESREVLGGLVETLAAELEAFAIVWDEDPDAEAQAENVVT